MPVERKTIKKGKCAALGCQRETKNRKYCNTCRKIISRVKDPVRYSYQNLKDHAKGRIFKKTGTKGIPFTITLDEFREFCFLTGYIQSKGKTIGCFDVDRVKEDEGYHIWNIQKLEKSENVKKYHRMKKLVYSPEHNGFAAIVQPELSFGDDEDLPF